MLRDPEAFASVVKFYDGLCSWEEGSPTPILHIGWAKPMVATIAKFDSEVRHKVAGKADEDEDESGEEGKLDSFCAVYPSDRYPFPHIPEFILCMVSSVETKFLLQNVENG